MQWLLARVSLMNVSNTGQAHLIMEQGDKIPTSNVHQLTMPNVMHIKDGAKTKLEIFTSTSEEPPVYRDDPSVMPIATVDYTVPEKLRKERSPARRSRAGKHGTTLASLNLKLEVKVDANNLNVSIMEAHSSHVLG